jgi:OmpA-OmpF porin, OOP family
LLSYKFVNLLISLIVEQIKLLVIALFFLFPGILYAQEEEKEQQNVDVPKPALQSNTKYDFVPGDKILYFEDFSKDAIGDMPAEWTTDGSGEVRTINNFPGNWFYFSSIGNSYHLMKNLNLPDNFILEFDIIPVNTEDAEAVVGFYMNVYGSAGDWIEPGGYPGDGGFRAATTSERLGLEGYAPEKETTENFVERGVLENEKLTHLIFWIQKRRVRIYCQGGKIMDLPTALAPDTKLNRIRFNTWDFSNNIFLSNLKITTAAADTRSKIMTEGRLVSYGIYFDIGKDNVKPESYGALNDIAKVLKENPSVRLKIVGHTDSDGDEPQNLDLSKRRAAMVKNDLIKNFGIDATRLESDGMGETKPVAPNDFPTNKALNRRVEFIKL